MQITLPNFDHCYYLAIIFLFHLEIQMEEWVGDIWHRFITRKASTEFDEARVTFNEVSKSVGMVFRVLGVDPVKRIEAASPREYLERRSFL